MPLNEKDVFEILALFEASDWQELELESGGYKLSVSKSGRPAAGTRASAPAAPRRERTPEPAVSPAPAARTEPVKPSALAPAEPVDPSWIAVRSPTLGNFYVAPKPGAPPFVEIGQHVAADDTVAIVEVMKLMNHVKAGAAGKIARVCGRNGEMVEFDEVLFWIDPS